MSTELSTTSSLYHFADTVRYKFNPTRDGDRVRYSGRGNKLYVIDRKRTVIRVDGGVVVEEFKSKVLRIMRKLL